MNYQISLSLKELKKKLTQKKRHRNKNINNDNDQKNKIKDITNDDELDDAENDKEEDNNDFIMKESPKDNEKNIEKNKETLESFNIKQDNVDIIYSSNNNMNNSIIINEYKEEFLNSNILLNQLKKTGKIYDQGFLFGNKDSKVFIGFQMKFFGNSTTLNDEMKKSITKDNLITKSRTILSRLYLDFHIKISKWYYFMILFYDSEEKSYNKYLKEHCIKESIEFIFYDPSVGLFFDNKENHIDKLELTLFGDLNISKINSPYNIFECDCNLYYEQIDRNTKIFTDNSNMKKEAENFLLKFGLKLSDLRKDLKSKINAKTIYLSGIFNLIEERPSLHPKDDNLFLFSSNNNKLLYLYKFENQYFAKFLDGQVINARSVLSMISNDKFLTFGFSR